MIKITATPNNADIVGTSHGLRHRIGVEDCVEWEGSMGYNIAIWRKAQRSMSEHTPPYSACTDPICEVDGVGAVREAVSGQLEDPVSTGAWMTSTNTAAVLDTDDASPQAAGRPSLRWQFGDVGGQWNADAATPLTVISGGSMSGERSGSGSSGGFSPGWCATGLGEYRPCRYTYQRYPYESLPPLDSAEFTGTFRWLGGLGEPVAEQVTVLDRVSASLAAEGLTLPLDFVAFQTDSKLDGALDEVSVTGCWTDISQPLPSPVEAGAFLVRFLRDQQDCVIWYLYLRPAGETFVVFSDIDYEGEYEARRDGYETETDLDDPEQQRSAISWCAPSFEEFAYRFWVENHLWRALRANDVSGLEPWVRDYLRHYFPPSS
ncbi:hypothetical protein [Actinocatenispora thailandica]|nr:hypothetical protein [Actinocatenispora thailandica]